MSPIYGDYFNDFENEFGINCVFSDEQGVIQKIKTFNENLLSIFSLNCQSLHSKFDNIVSTIDSFSTNEIHLNALCFQELWLNNDANMDNYRINNYDWYTKLRKKSRGGGVGILVSKYYKVDKLFDKFCFKENILESICLKLTYKNSKFCILNCYRPPNQSNDEIEEFFEIFLDLIDKISAMNLPYFITGDFNFDLFKLNNLNSNSMRIIEAFSFNGIINTITRATRITNHSATLLDLFGVGNFIQNLMSSFVLTTQISDHLPILNVFRIDKVNKPKLPDFFEKRELNDENFDSLNYALYHTDWNNVLNQNDVNLAYNNFQKTFLKLFNEKCPVRKKRKNKRTQPQQPFMSDHLLRCKLHRDSLHRNFLKNISPENEQIYKVYRNNYNRQVRKAKTDYYRKQIRDANGDGKKLWKTLKEVIGFNKISSECSYLQVGPNKIENEQEIANEFNRYFSQIGSSLTPEIPETPKRFYEYLPPPCQDSLFIEPLYPFKVINIIRSIKPKRSTDINDVSMFVLSRCADTIATPLTHIYNLSIQNGIFPENMKTSKIIVLHKSGSLSEADNHRGISLIDNFSKPLEKHICDSLVTFLEDRSFFSERQFGFIKGISTYHNLLNLSTLITQALSRNTSCMAIFLDIRKCFDMIDREILFSKLENSGIRGVALSWFKSYYANRKQRVFFKGLYSSTVEFIIIGVLQGSVLGPILFLIFINDLVSCSEEILINLFADDAVGFLEKQNIIQLINLAKDLIPKLTQWYNSNKLLIHPRKTKCMVFSSPREVLSPTELEAKTNFEVFINMNNHNENDQSKITKLELVNGTNEGSIKHLGVLIDEKMKFSYHLDKVYSKVSKIIYSMKVMKHILDKKHLRLLYTSYVKSNIEYCCLLFTACPMFLLTPIIKLQKQALRIIENLPNRAHTAQLFKENNILPFNLLIEFNVCKFMHSYKLGNYPRIFDGTWNFIQDRHTYGTRNRNNFAYEPNVNRNFLLHAPLNAFPTIFNNLPNEIKSIENKNLFKKKCFSHFLNKIEF